MQLAIILGKWQPVPFNRLRNRQHTVKITSQSYTSVRHFARLLGWSDTRHSTEHTGQLTQNNKLSLLLDTCPLIDCSPQVAMPLNTVHTRHSISIAVVSRDTVSEYRFPKCYLAYERGAPSRIECGKTFHWRVCTQPRLHCELCIICILRTKLATTD